MVSGLGCARARPVPRLGLARGPLLLLPVANLSGSPAPLAQVRASVSAALRALGVVLVGDEETEDFLARHRIRSTSGVSPESAQAAGEELGVSGIVVTVVAGYAESPPREAISMRLVAADEGAEVLWIDQAARTGADSPGAFDLGLVRDIAPLEAELAARLADSLVRGGVRRCEGGGRFAPAERFHAMALAGKTVAVLPFVDQTQRRDAGELMALEVMAQVHALGVTTVEPGALRSLLTEYRLPMEGGVSLDAARVLLALSDADLIVSGTVRDFFDSIGGEAPRVDFSMTFLSKDGEQVVWQSTSFHEGDDGVFFFGQGFVSTAAELACRMARSALDVALDLRRR